MLSRKYAIAPLGVALVLLFSPVAGAEDYSVKVVESAPPKEVAAPVAKLLSNQCVQLLDGKGQLQREFWFRKEVDVKNASKLEGGLQYRELPETIVLGVVRVDKEVTDYKKQRIPPGVFTLRLAKQPSDGDHMGTAIFPDFLLLTPVKDDKKADLMDPETLHEESAKTTKGHPAVWMLFPGGEAEAKPKVINKGRGHWVLYVQTDARAGDTKGALKIGLTVVGASPVA
jgi:hypothetical protein